MVKESFGYHIKRATHKGCWLFMTGNVVTYEIHRGPISHTWYVTEITTGITKACAGTMRDAVIKACILEELV